MRTNTHTPINVNPPSSLDADIFIPIDLNWREKYYKRVLKKRAWAFLLDGIINYFLLFLIDLVVVVIMYTSIHFISGKPFENININDENINVIAGSTFFLVVVLVALMESSKKKGSFGKRIMKIEVSDNYGNAISFRKSLWRNILKFLTFYSYFLVIPLIIQIYKYRKTYKLFHDQFSNTIIGERL